MFRTILSRDRAEDRRVDAFVAAIRASEHGTVQQPDDTRPLPLSLVCLLVPVAAVVVLAGCGAGPALMPVEESSTGMTATVSAPAPAPVVPEELTGTDAGLITEPAPTVQELEELDAAAGSVQPAPAPMAPAPAPVMEEPAPASCAAGEEWDPTIPACVAQQLPEESVGGARCPDPVDVVLSVDPWTCGPVQP